MSECKICELRYSCYICIYVYIYAISNLNFGVSTWKTPKRCGPPQLDVSLENSEPSERAPDEVHGALNLWGYHSKIGHGKWWKTGWWFGTFFIFPYIGNNHPNWLIFFRGVAQPPTRCWFMKFGVAHFQTLSWTSSFWLKEGWSFFMNWPLYTTVGISFFLVLSFLISFFREFGESYLRCCHSN